MKMLWMVRGFEIRQFELNEEDCTECQVLTMVFTSNFWHSLTFLLTKLFICEDQKSYRVAPTVYWLCILQGTQMQVVVSSTCRSLCRRLDSLLLLLLQLSECDSPSGDRYITLSFLSFSAVFLTHLWIWRHFHTKVLFMRAAFRKKALLVM